MKKKNQEGSLSSNSYPNTFDHSTTISYQIPGSCKVRLIVFDVAGRAFAELVDEEKQAGNYEVELIASQYGMKSGVGFVQLQAGDLYKTSKIIRRE